MVCALEPALYLLEVEKDRVVQIADIIDKALMERHDQEVLDTLKRDVTSICKQFPVYK